MTKSQAVARTFRAVLSVIGLLTFASPLFAQWTQSGGAVSTNPGITLVGVAHQTPAFNLDVLTGGQTNVRVKSTSASGISGLAGFLIDRGNANAPASFNFRTNGLDNFIAGMGVYAPGSDFQIGNNAAPFMTITGGGNIGIGTTNPGASKLAIAGNMTVSGSITGATVIGATYQDIAEWVPSTTKMAPGTVVVLNPEASNEVMPSGRSYDTMVAGVVSAQPGVLLGIAGEDKSQIATTGRVRVMVDARKKPIAVGDLLVTSDEPGLAMRSEPMEIAGRKLHQPGTILGKALEPLPSGRGEILVLLSLQ